MANNSYSNSHNKISLFFFFRPGSGWKLTLVRRSTLGAGFNTCGSDQVLIVRSIYNESAAKTGAAHTWRVGPRLSSWPDTVFWPSLWIQLQPCCSSQLMLFFVNFKYLIACISASMCCFHGHCRGIGLVHAVSFSGCHLACWHQRHQQLCVRETNWGYAVLIFIPGTAGAVTCRRINVQNRPRGPAYSITGFSCIESRNSPAPAKWFPPF